MEKILIVDDVELNRAILSAIFEEQYEVIEASDGEEAVDVLEEYRREISLVFLDIMMPKKSGYDVLIYMRLSNLIDEVPVIVVTSDITDESQLKAYEYGAADVIAKPFSAPIVTRRAMNLMEQYRSRVEMEAELEQRTREVIESHEQMMNMNEFLLEALGSVVEFRSLESGAHVKRVKFFTKIILEYVKSYFPEYGLTNEQIMLMSQAAALHDVGKVAISDSILKAPRKLTADEFDDMKQHTVIGCEIMEKFKLTDSEFYKYSYDICRWHHEKYDGGGYPDGLVGDAIPVYCQAVALADCFDALSSKRVYKDAYSYDEAFNMIINGECGVFSEQMLLCFKKAREDLISAFENSKENTY